MPNHILLTMDFLDFSYYYASLIEPKVRESQDKTRQKSESQKRKPRHLSPWKVALLYDFCPNVSRWHFQLEDKNKLSKRNNPCRRSKTLPRDGCHGNGISRDGCHGNCISRDPLESVSRETSTVDLVEYCLQLLDRYSLSGSFPSLRKSDSSRSLRSGGKLSVRTGSLNDVTSLARDVTSPRRSVTSRDSCVTSRESSVTESSELESPAISSDSFSPECLLQTFCVRLHHIIHKINVLILHLLNDQISTSPTHN